MRLVVGSLRLPPPSGADRLTVIGLRIVRVRTGAATRFGFAVRVGVGVGVRVAPHHHISPAPPCPGGVVAAELVAGTV